MKSEKYISSENVDNHFVGCVNLKADWGAKRGDGRCVRMHVNFGEHEDVSAGLDKLGKYSLTVRKGKLLLKIEGGYSPEESWDYAHEMQPQTDAELVRSESVKKVDEKAGELTSGLGIEGSSGKATVGSKAGTRHSKEEAGGSTIQHSVKLLHIEAEGGDKEPRWVFSPVPPYNRLRGFARTNSLATVFATDDDCRVVIRFQVRDIDIDINPVSGFFLERVTGGASKKLIKHLILKLVRERAGDCFSEGEILFDE